MVKRNHQKNLTLKLDQKEKKHHVKIDKPDYNQVIKKFNEWIVNG